MNFKNKVDYWTIVFSILSLILFNLALLFPEQRALISLFAVVAIIFALFLFYINKIDNNEISIASLNDNFEKLSNTFIEKFNYIRELYNIKLRIEMLEKKKKGQINLMDLVKIIVAFVIIYFIISILRTLG